MNSDKFISVNVTDTCAVWHLVGSPTLFTSAVGAKLSFIITPTVDYECFTKQGVRPVSVVRLRLREHLRAHLNAGRVSTMSVSIESLQATILAAKEKGLTKRLGRGELSCVALARDLGHAAVLTDNKREFRVIEPLVDGRLQKTPQLLGWLYMTDRLSDGDVDLVIQQHEQADGHLGKWLRVAHRTACEKRLAARIRSETGHSKS